MNSSRQTEKIIKGFANHRRIDMLKLIKSRPELSLNDVSGELRMNLKTVSEHLRRLTIAGLIYKRSRGHNVLHKISPLGDEILKFLKKLDEQF
jgi:DNA-binding transcriptional ArsR family regulator